MTREEAILCLKGMKNYGRDTFTGQTDWQESLDMAIKALEQQPCKELFDDWHEAPSYAMTLEQAREAVHELRKEIVKLRKEPREDAVSRETVITGIKDWWNLSLSTEGAPTIFDYIRELPSVTPTLKEWIPVSERLPEEEVRVMICTVDGKIDIAEHSKQEWSENKWEWFVLGILGYAKTYRDNEVVAWMPLTEPYKEVG